MTLTDDNAMISNTTVHGSAADNHEWNKVYGNYIKGAADHLTISRELQVDKHRQPRLGRYIDPEKKTYFAANGIDEDGFKYLVDIAENHSEQLILTLLENMRDLDRYGQPGPLATAQLVMDVVKEYMRYNESHKPKTVKAPKPESKKYECRGDLEETVRSSAARQDVDKITMVRKPYGWIVTETYRRPHESIESRLKKVIEGV